MKFWQKMTVLGVSTLAILWPFNRADAIGLILAWMQVILLVFSIGIVTKEPSKKNKHIFIVFAVFSCSFVPFFVHPMIGVSYTAYFVNVFSQIAYYSLNALVVCYITVDLLFREWKTTQKYLLTFTVVIGFMLLYYFPFFQDPLYLYHTERILNWKELDTARENYLKEESREPTLAELDSEVRLHYWKDQKAIGLLSAKESSIRVKELFPMLVKDNWVHVFNEPLYRRNISMNVLILGLVLVYFGYLYKKDPPQGVYVDKIMFLFLVNGATEVFHTWSFLTSPNREIVHQLSMIGNYITALVYCAMVVFFVLRLRFITSIQGEFYEQELALRPTKVTRWRDGMDNFILKYFTSEKDMKRRLFAANASSASLSTATVSETVSEGNARP